MKKLLVSALFVLSCTTVVQAGPFERIKGLGKDRERLTPELLQLRLEATMDAIEFWILRQPAMQFAPNRILEPEMWNLIEKSSRDAGIDPFVLGGLIMLESQGRPYVKSSTGPLGICQFSKALAKDLGLIETAKQKQSKYVWVGKGKKRHKVLKYGKAVEVTVHDYRLDVNRAVPACAQWLAAGVKTYGAIDFAIQRHHNGDARLRKIISLYTGEKTTEDNAAEIVSRHNLTMAKIYFSSTPYHKPELYEYMEKIRKEADSAPNYFLRQGTAQRILTDFATKPEGPELYAARFRYFQTQFKPDGVAPNRQWYFYTPEQLQHLQFADLLAIQNTKRLVRLPEPWNEFGIIPRLTGISSIGEKDKLNQLDYIQAEPAIIGAMLYATEEVKLLQGDKFMAYETNSLVRSTKYQDMLSETNKNADTVLPIHTTGKAGDFPMKGISPARRRDMLFILFEMDSYGMISYVPEGKQDTIHVVVHPQWEEFFQRYYDYRTRGIRALAQLQDGHTK
ncbi:MAG: lytic transglycosylase domain-containing protein [Candidatus Doudnabacteria bacterium]|nr:lytic transglycosylase domain-containing protein [Candidatus Doudnabacteria bacterium]